MRYAQRLVRRASLTGASIIGTSLAAAALVLGVAIAPVLLPAPHAFATVGVDDYPANLKSSSQDSLVDPWNFYNRECTSFVAWRLNHDAGVPFHNYYLGPHWGDASHWRTAAVTAGVTVDNAPTAGSVAWWAAGSAGSSRGHVAWVKSVTSTSVTIEEYNYLHRGGYDTRTIAETDAVYPSGFIHVGGGAMKATARPTITGTPQVGVKLLGSTGSWTPTGATYAYQWYANGVAITGATGVNLTPRAAQLDQLLQLAVTASKEDFASTSIKTFRTAAVAPGVITMTAPPVVSGTPKVGVQLSTTAGTWSPAATYGYQWYADGVAVPNATTSIFTPTATEKGKAITAVVTATRTGYTTVTGTTTATADVAPGTFTTTVPPTITGIAQVGQPLTAGPGTWSPAAVYAFRWLVDGVPVAGATGTSYSPTADDLRKPITVQVTASQAGYTSSTVSSAATDPVAPGNFLNSRDPAISGTPKVGVTLTADPGDWSPEATFGYQWLANGVAIADSTSQTFTPTPAEYQRKITVQVTASRRGYLTALAPSAPTVPVAPGTISATDAPSITGHPWVGSTLTATAGTWNVDPESVSAQWLADGAPIAGATHATYQPTEADLGRLLSVTVTVGAQGYQPASSTSATTTPVALGRASLASPPVIAGRAIYGHTMTVTAGAPTPTTATIAYQWFRGPDPIRGATSSSYTLRSGDVGRFVRARLTVSAPQWETTQVGVRSDSRGLSVPKLAVRPQVRGNRAVLGFIVIAPGIEAPGGLVTVLEDGHQQGLVKVTDGFGRLRLSGLSRGHHHLVIEYDGGALTVPIRQRADLTVD